MIDIKSHVKTDDSVHVTILDVNRGEQNIIWVSDLHGDNPKSNFKFFERIARKYPDALIVIGGDHLDVMQNFGDRRQSKKSLREELKDDAYLNAVIDYNVDLWSPYAKRILSFFIGNHESTQIKFHGMDISREVVKTLNLKFGTNILLGDLAGWLKLRFMEHGRGFTQNVYYAHKPISGGTRSKGMLSVDLLKGRYPDADIYITEHIHNTWIKPERIETLDNSGKIVYKNKWFIQMPTLKDEFSGIKRGYSHERNYEATPIGVVVFGFHVSREGVSVSPKYELV